MHWTKRLVLVLGAAALLATSALPAAAQSADDAPFDLQSQVDEFVGLVSGGVAAVTIRDGVTTTAAAGIANIEGEPMTVDMPMLVGGASISMVYGLALQLVEEGLLDLDARVTDYLPHAPVGEGATVRDLLSSRHGIPEVMSAVYEHSMEDPDHSWTTDEMLDLADRSTITAAGEFTPGYAGTLVTKRLVEAVVGTDFGTALQERIAGPLGLDATVYPGGDLEPPTITAGGWSASGGTGELSYVTDDREAMRSSRPNVSTAFDIANFLSAYMSGQVVSPELLEETAWNEEVEILGYGFLRHDELFPAAGPLGARYFGLNQWEDSGVDFTVAGAPSTGDVVVVMANSWALESRDLARDIVRSWAPDPLATATLSPARMTARFVIGMACDLGDPIPFDLPPCDVDGPVVTWPFEAPFEYSGTFDGSGFMAGAWTIDRDDYTFTYTSRGVFMGEVEGCGYGTFYFEVLDGAGHQGPEGPAYTAGTAIVLPGGTLPLAGTIDQSGKQVSHPDGTATVEHTGMYTCDIAP